MAVFGIIVTLAVFLLSRLVYKRWSVVILSPILTSLLAMIAILVSLHVSYKEYWVSAKWLKFMLQPATVAFAIPLYKYFPVLRRNAVPLLTSIILGGITAVTTSVLFADLFHLQGLAASLAPRSITTPLAMDTSAAIGGNPVLTAVFVIVTALVGIMTGPLLIRRLKLRSKFAQGALMGTGAHAIGTSRAFEMGQLEGTIASIALIINGVSTVVLAPLLMHWM
ncbi:LrgB family protein [Alicyclobacillus sp. SO9]|uniref:LrgB family protein n=1 Tax=Alicyclobacillus sp. SO9 TaxID=2665646 RepID=UPI001E30EB91|nr:LrgB family protein [Alicyclobacillus sp. SO9]